MLLQDLLLHQQGPGLTDLLAQQGPGPGQLVVDPDVDVGVEGAVGAGLGPGPHALPEGLPVGARPAVPDAQGVGGRVGPVPPVGVEVLNLAVLEVDAGVVVDAPEHHAQLGLHLHVGPTWGQPLEPGGPAAPGVGRDYEVSLHPPLLHLILLHLQPLTPRLHIHLLLLQFLDFHNHLLILLLQLAAFLLNLVVLILELDDILLMVDQHGVQHNAVRVELLNTDIEGLDQPVEDGAGGGGEVVGVDHQGLVPGVLLLGVLPGLGGQAVLVPHKGLVLELVNGDLLGGDLQLLHQVLGLVPDHGEDGGDGGVHGVLGGVLQAGHQLLEEVQLDGAGIC